MLSRRKFLKAGALWIPSAPFICRAPPSLSFQGGGKKSTLRNGLVSYWKFDEVVAGNRADSVGSNTFVQGTQTFPAITGLLNDAVGSVGSTPTGRLHADSFPSDSSFSFTLWFRYQGGQISASPIIAKVLGSPTGGGYALINGSGGGGTANWNIYNASGTIVNSCTNGATVVQGTWMHCVLVFDASTNKALQYNNTVLGTQSGSGTPGSNSASLTVQTWSDNSTGAGSCCDIDEMGYYNRALNAGEVTKLFNGGTPLPLASF